ncbi:helix-turn-helix domain-containing protein [Allomuricauda sp. F6463D]|uniref:helix-turn-helix domain-containing protein n=1 Tax=Allomuricauda sp. F6463D TaxID=2926409 RepID=UPI001FF60E9B|nr:helix-turn-helix domain-containing protein [Muricauda sp. F6463D]MCK0160522.1 helix-turn-helix domain-containing protein [Muricauda sp. F6463D]
MSSHLGGNQTGSRSFYNGLWGNPGHLGYHYHHSFSWYGMLFDLFRTTKKHTGIKVKAHISEILTEEVKTLLQDTAPIKEIAQILGFKTLYGFSKFFKRNASLPPQILSH